MDAIDWATAQRVGELIAGAPPPGGVRADSVEPLARDYAERVAAYGGLHPTRGLPPLEVVDRATWIAANLQTMRPMLAPLGERLGEQGGALGPLRSVSGMLLGAQVGGLTGLLSQRVLGQYDLALLDAEVPPRLLLLAPNLAHAARTLAVDRDQLVRWVTIHEITHAVQFGGAPWLRDHIGGMLSELLEGLQVSLLGADGNGPGGRPRIPSMPDLGAMRDLVERARRGELIRITVGEDRWRLVERMQAAMSLIEGHAEHTMDAVGAEVLPALPELRAAMTRRRTQRGLPWRVVEKLLGLELKMRQYETGRRFCDAVVAEGGPELLARVWSGPEAMPSTEELEQPALWTARIGAVAA